MIVFVGRFPGPVLLYFFDYRPTPPLTIVRQRNAFILYFPPIKFCPHRFPRLGPFLFKIRERIFECLKRNPAGFPALVLLYNCEILNNNVQTAAPIGLVDRVRIHDNFNGFALDSLGLSGLYGQPVIITVVLEPINH